MALVAVLLSDVYIWYNFVHGAALPWSAAYWIPTLVLAVSMILFRTHSSQTTINIAVALLLCVAAPKLIFTLVSLAGRLGSGIWPAAAAYADWTGLALAIAAGAVLAYGCTKGWKRLTVRHVEIGSEDLPLSFDGYRIVQMSDLHLGTFGRNDSYMRSVAGRIGDIAPDLVAFTGDLVNISPEEAEPFVKAMSSIHARDGVVSVLGNHDYCPYKRNSSAEQAARDLEYVKQIERRAGWRMLLNENIPVVRGGDTIHIVGVENTGRPPFPSYGDLKGAMRGLPEGGFKVLLSHDPTHWRDEVLPASDIQLTLSGHTHAMQLKVCGFSPSSLMYSEWGGMYEHDGRMLNVSTGTGGNLPFRLGAWPEIVVVTLRSGRKAAAETETPDGAVSDTRTEANKAA